MKPLWSDYRGAVGAACLALALAAAWGTPASAQVSFEWNPAGVGVTTDGPFTADRMTTADYVGINITGPDGSNPGNFLFNETGMVNAAAFTDLGSAAFTPGLGQTLLHNGYVIYATFTATGSIAASNFNLGVGQSGGGVFDTFSYDLWAAQSSGPSPNFSANANGSGATLTGTDAPVLLADGSMVGVGTATLSNSSNGLSAGANILATFNEDATAQADNFFLAPPSNIALNLFSSTTNTGSVLTLANCAGPDKPTVARWS